VAKLGGALQEADESQLWLEYLREDCQIEAEKTLPLESEAHELIAIFVTMIKRTRDCFSASQLLSFSASEPFSFSASQHLTLSAHFSPGQTFCTGYATT